MDSRFIFEDSCQHRPGNDGSAKSLWRHPAGRHPSNNWKYDTQPPTTGGESKGGSPESRLDGTLSGGFNPPLIGTSDHLPGWIGAGGLKVTVGSIPGYPALTEMS